MLTLFLDFDGVVNRGFGSGEPDLVARLNTITASTGAVIVVHSSWRYERTVEQLRDILVSWGVTGTVLDKCPSPLAIEKPQEGFLITIEDWSDFKRDIQSNDERCIAIQRWLDDHPEVTTYVILDDCSALGHFVGTPSFIRTRMNEGLTENHVQRAITHLKKSPDIS